MKSYRAKALAQFAAIIALAALTGCAADTLPSSDADTVAEGDATQSEEDANSTEDTITPDADSSDVVSDTASDTTDAQDTHTPDTHAPDAPDTQEVDAQPDTVEETPGATCESAIDVTAGGVWDDRTTEGAGDNYNAPFGGEGCPAGQYTAGDEVFVLAPGVDTNYDVIVTSTDPGFDPIVYIRDDCSVDACLYGSKWLSSQRVISLRGVEVPANDRYFIIVDTDDLTSEGAYKIEITVN